MNDDFVTVKSIHLKLNKIDLLTHEEKLMIRAALVDYVASKMKTGLELFKPEKE